MHRVLAGYSASVTAWEAGCHSQEAGAAAALVLPSGGEDFQADLRQGKPEPALSPLRPQELPIRAGGVLQLPSL